MDEAIRLPALLEAQRVGHTYDPQKKNPKRMERDVNLAFEPEWLQRIHPQPWSYDGKKAIELYNVVAFHKTFNSGFKTFARHRDYGALCREMNSVFGMPKEELDRHIMGLLERNVICLVPAEKRPAAFTPFPFLAQAKLTQGTADRFIRRDRTQNTISVPEQKKRFEVPEFFKRAPKHEPLEGGKSYRRQKAVVCCDATLMFPVAVQRRIHPEPLSTDGLDCLTVFSIVAFANAYIDCPPGCVKKQANQMSYRQVVLYAEACGIAKKRTDRHLEQMFQRRVLRVEDTGHGAYSLTASMFLDSAEIISDRADARALTPYEAIAFNEDAKAHIPERFFAESFCAPSASDFGLTRYGKSERLFDDVAPILDPTELRKIHPEHESMLDGQHRMFLVNLALFGSRFIDNVVVDNRAAWFVDESVEMMEHGRLEKIRIPMGGVSYGVLCRAGMYLGISYEDLESHIDFLLQNEILHVKKNGSVFTALPFVCNAKLVPNPEEKAKHFRSESLKHRLERTPYSVRLESQRKHAAERRAETVARRKEVCAYLGLTITEGLCTGCNGHSCVSGEEGNPRAITKDDWFQYFGISFRAGRMPKPNRCCDACFAMHRYRPILHSGNVLAMHTDGSVPNMQVKIMLEEMIGEQNWKCALCNGDMERDNGKGCAERGGVNPWKPSFNIKNPRSRKVFSDIESLRAAGNIVHVACNFAQHDTQWDDFLAICELVARRMELPHKDRPEQIHLKRPDVDRLCELGARSHGLQPLEVCEIIGALVTPEPLSGLSIGYGSDFDIDISNADLPSLLRLTIDRIDGHTDSDSISNYRVIPRLINWVTNDFADKTNVVCKWKGQIAAKFGREATESDGSGEDECSENDEKEESSEENEDHTEAAHAGTKRKYEYSFACPYEGCSRVERIPVRLHTHINQHHTGSRPYRCLYDGCVSAFAARGGLQQHMRSSIHTLVRQYRCQHSVCRRVYSDKDTRNTCFKSH